MKADRAAILGDIWRGRGKCATVTAAGYSMQPLIKDGAQLLVRPCEPQEIRPGDIALLRQGETLIAHRVVLRRQWDGGLYIGHKGDNAHSAFIVPAEDVYGRVVEIRRPDGVIDLDEPRWRRTNRILGRYWAGVFGIWGRKFSPGGPWYLPWKWLNYALPRRIIDLGGRRPKMENKPAWERLLCASIAVNPAVVEGSLPSDAAQWEDFMTLAGAQNIQGLCQAYLARCHGRVPDEVMSRLAKSAHAVGFRNMGIYREIEELAAAFNAAGVEIILLKGAAFARDLYASMAQRSMRDIDLLIKPEDLAQAESVLTQKGYRAVETDNVPAEWCRRHSIKVSYARPDAACKIELHWGFERYDNPFPIDYTELWQYARQVAVGSSTALALPPEDALLHLAVHAVFQHCLAVDLRTWADIARLAPQVSDWGGLLETAEKYRLERALYVALYLAHSFGQARIPAQILDKLKSACPGALAGWLTKQAGPLQLQRPALETLWRLKLIRGWAYKLRYLRHILLPDRDELALLQPNPELGRLGHLLAWYGGIAGKLWRKLTLTPGRDNAFV